MEQEQQQSMRCILSIDMGIRHLALVTIHTPQDYATLTVTQAQVTDNTAVPCLQNCAHSRNAVDWMAHVFEYNRQVLGTRTSCW